MQVLAGRPPPEASRPGPERCTGPGSSTTPCCWSASWSPTPSCTRAPTSTWSAAWSGTRTPGWRVVVEVADRHPSRGCTRRVERTARHERARLRPPAGERDLRVLGRDLPAVGEAGVVPAGGPRRSRPRRPRPTPGPCRRGPGAREPGTHARASRSRPTRTPGRSQGYAAEWADRGGAFLAEASELLSGQLDEDMVAALAGQLLVPRLAEWCAVWLTTEGGGMRLSRVWHRDERRVDALRFALESDPPAPSLRTVGIPWPWPGECGRSRSGRFRAGLLPRLGRLLRGLADHRPGRAARDDRLRRADRGGRGAPGRTGRRHGPPVHASDQHQPGASAQTAPPSLASLPGVESAIVYEPHGRGRPSAGTSTTSSPWGTTGGASCSATCRARTPKPCPSPG